MTYTIRAGQPVSGKHWELDFNGGVAYTDDAALAERYRARGYAVECAAPAEADDTKKARRPKCGTSRAKATPQ